VSRSMVSVLVAMWPSFARAAPEKRAWLASKPTDGIGRLAGAPKARPFGTSEAHQPSGARSAGVPSAGRPTLSAASCARERPIAISLPVIQ
jgi:hypothetical protein